MSKMADINILLTETIDRLMEDKPSGTAEELANLVCNTAHTSAVLKAQSLRDANAGYKAWDSACMNLGSMKGGLIPIDEVYLQAVRNFFQMDRHLPREETKDGNDDL